MKDLTLLRALYKRNNRGVSPMSSVLQGYSGPTDVKIARFKNGAKYVYVNLDRELSSKMEFPKSLLLNEHLVRVVVHRDLDKLYYVLT